MAGSSVGQQGWLTRHLPILGWGRTYDRGWLRTDVLAGITVAALVIPKALGYAGIANVPIENGLYAAAAGTILYALFGTSRQLSTGPSSALSAVAGSAVILTGVTGTAAATSLVSAVALVTGAIFLVMAVLRMGWISQFMSKAVITGFLFGAALDVTVGELPKLTGTSTTGSSVWQEFASWLGGLGQLQGATLVVGLIALVALFGLHRLGPAFPGTLVVVIGGLVASAVFNLEAHGVAVIGDVPRGLPLPVIPDLQLVSANLLVVFVAAIGIVAIGFSQTAGDARFFAARHGYRIDINQEIVAEGIANLGSGLLQGIPVSTSLSASSLNDNSGARSGVASLATGAVVVLTLIVFAPLFSNLPKAVLGAVIIDAVIIGMIDLPEMRRLYRVKPFDFGVAVAALLGVLTFGVLGGIVVGVALSLGWIVYVTATPEMPALGRAKGTHVFRPLDAFPDGERFPGILALRLDGGLFFVTADALGDRIRELVISADPPVTAVVLDCQGLDFIDSQGSAKLAELARVAGARNISFRLARVKPSVADVLALDGTLDQIGADHIHPDVNAAVTAELARDSAAGRR